MNKPIRTISVFCLVLFAALMLNATYLQYLKADDLDDNPANVRTKVAAFSRDRGAILIGRTPIAESKTSDDRYDYQRVYNEPYKYAHITGWYYFDNSQGTCSTCQQGVEQTQNDVLNGDDPRLFVTKLVDLLRNDTNRGGSVQLTIDADAQDAAYEGLESLPGDVEASVVAIAPSSGKILAMASLPTFDPNTLASHDTKVVVRNANKLSDADGEPLLNRAIQKTLPPGSTFKLVTAAAAIESGDYDADSEVPGGPTYTPPQTSKTIGNEGRSCGSAGGKIPFSQAMENSCNTTFAQLAVDLGPEAMRKAAEGFGFNSTYFEDLLPQATSVYPESVATGEGEETRELTDAETAQTGIGQFDVRSTPLQMAMVAAGIANGGVVMKPYLIDEVQSAEYDVLAKTDDSELSRAIKSSTADDLTTLLVDTVNDGTASPAKIPGVNVAGKTGTAQSGTDAPPYAWFVSFAPAEDPEVAVAVMIEQADIDRGEIAGGLLGGPIAKAVMEAVINDD